MKINNNEIFIENTKKEWSIAHKTLLSQRQINKINVLVNDKHTLHNLIYFLVIIKRFSNIKLVIINKVLNEDQNLYFSIGCLFFLTPNSIKENIFYKTDEEENAKKIPMNYTEDSKLNFWSTLPFLEFNSKNIGEITKSFNKYGDYKDILDLQGTNDSIGFIFYLVSSVKKLTDTKINKEFFNKSEEEISIFAMFLMIYTFLNKSGNGKYIIDDNISKMDMQDIKLEIRNFSNGFYQIIENSCFHSKGEYCLCYFSKIYIPEKQNKSLTTFVSKQLEYSQKKISFLKEYSFIIDNIRNMFALCVDDIYKNDKRINMVETFNGINNNKIINLEELFTLLYNDVNIESSIIASKYGIRSFINSSKTLSMQVKINSAEDSVFINNYDYFENDKLIIEDKEKNINDFVTEYAILLPFKSISRHSKKFMNNISRSMISNNEEYSKVSLDEIFSKNINFYMNNSEKEKIIESISNEIKIFIDKEENIIYTLKYEENHNKIELLVKVIANIISYCIQKEQEFYFAINFFDENTNSLYFKLSEFFDYLSIFYSRIKIVYKSNEEDYINKIQSLYQIAIYYTNNKNYTYLSTIVGTEYNVAVQSFVNNLLYDNIHDNLEKFNLYIDEINNSNKNKVSCINVFPFDIKMATQKGKISFIDNLKNKYLKDRYTYHANLNVLLGSGLHLDTFYDASIFFQNKYFVQRVAFYIKNDILKSIDNSIGYNSILLVGYAAYSHMLCDEISKMLELEENRLQVKKVYVSNIGDLSIEGKQIEYSNNIYIVSLLPIGSTLNTFFKMNLALARYWKFDDINKYYSHSNYCVVAVSSDNNLYWKTKEKAPNDIFTTIELNEKLRDKSFKLLVNLQTKWSEDGNCLAITHVDKTSTLLNTIFVPENEEEIKSPYNKSQDILEFKKFLILNKNVKYGHYYSKNNHHLFYINYRMLLDDDKKYDEVIKYYKKELGENIDPLAYNILISPLHNSNEKFLEGLIKEVFNNNISLIQFDPLNNYRENFIYKFSYITERIKNICEKSKNTKINIYYLDNTIISGKTFLRAKELIISLIPESVRYDRIDTSIFSKAILLINRLSENSLNSLMGTKDNVISYLNINCPYFETSSGICPDCKITENYKKLATLSIDQELKNKFMEKAQEHKVIPAKKISKNEYNHIDFLRMYYTHYVLKAKKYLHDFYEKHKQGHFTEKECSECINDIFMSGYNIINKYTKTNEKIEFTQHKIIFAKILSRPSITLYENLKQIALIYLKKELENMLFDNESLDIEYCKLLITRISYFGSMYLNDNINKFRTYSFLDEVFLNITVFWENMYNRGIIK